MRKICWIAGLLLIGLHEVSLLPRAQEPEGQETRPGSTREILAATREFEQAVNGKAVVRNRCRVQGKDTEIEETAEVIKQDGCKLVLRARKVTRTVDAPAAPRPAEKESSKDNQSADDHKQFTAGQQEIEFTAYADLSELTTPVLVETQKFGQCETTGAPVLKVSSRSEPGKAMRVSRKAHASNGTKDDPGHDQTRRDLSLFFSVPASAEKTRRALERAVKSCGGKEWPDEDDLP